MPLEKTSPGIQCVLVSKRQSNVFLLAYHTGTCLKEVLSAVDACEHLHLQAVLFAQEEKVS